MTVPPTPPVPDPPGSLIPALPPLARQLISDRNFTSCRNTVMDANPDMPAEMAARVVEEGIKFVAACARHAMAGLAPSRIVDEGWHALILHTAMYAELCQSLADEVVHHYPGYDPTNYDPPILDRTQEMIRAIGYEPDAELWGPPSDETLVSVAAKCQHAPECTIRPMPYPQPPVA
ncbi:MULTISPECIES: glycine-rich domain-containing protein [unclassified Streptomyces]|uniref:glycine-rich domain-containing protein n=1 Tax=unclassified Streptomyces TaxID=2593676 RepID=UPI0036E7C5FB